MLRIQRSIPIPRVKLERLIAYILYLGDTGEAAPDELKRLKLDFGRGKGDITRFFERLGIVGCSNGRVRLTEVGVSIYNAFKTDVVRGRALLHVLLYGELPHYKALIDIVYEKRVVDIGELKMLINEELKKYSPTAWINDVAFKTVLGMAVDLEAIEIEGNIVRARFAIPIEKCINEAIADIHGRRVLKVAELEKCLSKFYINIDVNKLLTLIGNCVEKLNAPGPYTINYVIVRDRECLIKGLTRCIALNGRVFEG